MHHLSVSSNLRLNSRTEGFFSLEVQATANKVPSNTLTARIHVPGGYFQLLCLERTVLDPKQDETRRTSYVQAVQDPAQCPGASPGL